MTVGITFQGVLPAFSGFKYADKASHAIYGAVIGGITSAIAYKVGLPPFSAGFVMAAIFAFAKEVYDEKVRRKSWELLDMVATIAIPTILMIIFK